MATVVTSTAHLARSPTRGVVAVSATYVVFLLFAQYGLLRLARARVGDAELQPLLVAMGVAGIVASLAAGFLSDRSPSRWLRAGFTGCAVAAAAAPANIGFGGLVAVAAVVGASLGAVTVTLAANLRALLPGPRFGLWVGAGTGSAYLLCNVPALFDGAPEVQCGATAVAALAGLAAVWRTMPDAATVVSGGAVGPDDCRSAGFASLVLAFVALVWLDSAAFAVIQQNAALRLPTWGDATHQWTMGGVHAAAALIAGLLFDRGVFRGLLLAAYALFVVAFAGLQHDSAVAAVGPLYAVGISLYSTALVAFPAGFGLERGLVPRRWRAAAVYGIAGWCGSALGVGMAQRLERIPVAFEIGAGAVLLAAWALPRTDLRQLARSFGMPFAAVVATVVAAVLQPGVAGGGSAVVDGDASGAAERGRRVYLAEGCLNCHSQYIRPGSRDLQAWGPYRPVAASEQPPLLGNRRQGPDLRNVGARRGPAWQRLHLIDPRSTSPGSRMPGYAHLFGPGDRRGEDLVSFLESLGAGAGEDEAAGSAPRPKPRGVENGRAWRGRASFATYCVACHGADARGDGPLAEALGRAPAMDLRKGLPWLVSWGAGAPPLREGLAQVIRYGIEGTEMPGHETLDERTVADLAAYVEEVIQLAGAGPRSEGVPR